MNRFQESGTFPKLSVRDSTDDSGTPIEFEPRPSRMTMLIFAKSYQSARAVYLLILYNS